VIGFNRDASGKVIEAVTDDRGTKETWAKTGKPLPVRIEIKLHEPILTSYTGEYELAPGFILTVTREGDRLFTQATGQSKVEIFAESETKFFLKVVDAQLEFIKDDSGKVIKVILYQGGQKLEGPKIR